MEKLTFNRNLENKHLKDGIKPIMVCVGFPDQRLHQSDKIDYNFRFSGEISNVDNVDYEGSILELEKKGMKNAGVQTYVISKINEKDKFSRKFYDCTGVIVVGKDIKTMKDISFMSHQDPKKCFSKENNKLNKKIEEEFEKDIEEQLEKIKNKSTEKTIDALIIGGNYLNEGKDGDEDFYKKNYEKQIKFLKEKIFEKFGFYPEVAPGPKLTSGSDAIFFDNKNRRVYLSRNTPLNNPFLLGYNSRDFDKKKKNWE